MINYNSFLICDHEKITNFYLNGIEIADYHKETKEFKLKNGTPQQLKLIKDKFLDFAWIFENNLDKV